MMNRAGIPASARGLDLDRTTASRDIGKEAILDTLSATVSSLPNAMEGEVIGSFARICVFGCTACDFVLFNKQTKSSQFSPSHVCPGHGVTRVGCCSSGNFQAWRDKDFPEKNVLQHLFGIKNSHPVPICANVETMAILESKNQILITFKSGEQQFVYLERIDKYDFRARLLERAQMVASGENISVLNAPSSVVRSEFARQSSRYVPGTNATHIESPRSSFKPKRLDIPNHKRYPENTARDEGNDTESIVPPVTVMVNQLSVQPSKTNSGMETNIPKTWLLYSTWQEYDNQYQQARKRLLDVEATREQLLAALEVYKRQQMMPPY